MAAIRIKSNLYFLYDIATLLIDKNDFNAKTIFNTQLYHNKEKSQLF